MRRCIKDHDCHPQCRAYFRLERKSQPEAKPVPISLGLGSTAHPKGRLRSDGLSVKCGRDTYTRVSTVHIRLRRDYYYYNG